MRSCGHHPLQVHLLLRGDPAESGPGAANVLLSSTGPFVVASLLFSEWATKHIQLLSSTGPFVVARRRPACPRHPARRCYPLQVHLLLRDRLGEPPGARVSAVVILYRSICCCERRRHRSGLAVGAVVILYRSICCCEGPGPAPTLTPPGGCYPLQVHLLLRAGLSQSAFAALLGCYPLQVHLLLRALTVYSTPSAVPVLLSSTGPFVVASRPERRRRRSSQVVILYRSICCCERSPPSWLPTRCFAGFCERSSRELL